MNIIYFSVMMPPRSTPYSGLLYPPPTPASPPSNPTMFYPMMQPNVALMHSSAAPMHFVNNSLINHKLQSHHPATVLGKSTLNSPNVEVSTSHSCI